MLTQKVLSSSRKGRTPFCLFFCLLPALAGERRRSPGRPRWTPVRPSGDFPLSAADDSASRCRRDFHWLTFVHLGILAVGLDAAPLGDLIYHLLSISFIAMGLRALPPKKTGGRVFATGLCITASFTLQALLGLGLAFLLRAVAMPRLNPAIGLGWEAMGFQGAASLGLTFASLAAAGVKSLAGRRAFASPLRLWLPAEGKR